MKGYITKLTLINNDGSEVEIENALSLNAPNLKANKKQPSTVIVAGNFVMSRALAKAFKQLEVAAAEASKCFARTANKIILADNLNSSLDTVLKNHIKKPPELKPNNQPRHREHGWYNKFNKSDKRKNLRTR